MATTSGIAPHAADVAEIDVRLTLDEFEKRFPNEWILLVDPEADEHSRVLRGAVSKSRPA